MSVRRSFLLALLVLATLPVLASRPFPIGGRPTFLADTTGVYIPSTGQWLLRTSNTSGDPDISVKFGGQTGDLPFAGDWDGDGQTDIGVFRNGTFLRARISFVEPLCLPIFPCTPPPSAEPFDSIVFGQAGDLPVAGDWDGDGIDDIGVFRPGEQGLFILRLRVRLHFQFCLICPPRFFIRTRTIPFGTAGNRPVAGDWNGDGFDDVGVFDKDGAAFILTEDGAKPTFVFTFGTSRDLPLAGDWEGTGQDGVGVYDNSVPTMFLSPDIPGEPSIVFSLGVQSGGLPVAGHWEPIPE